MQVRTGARINHLRQTEHSINRRQQILVQTLLRAGYGAREGVTRNVIERHLVDNLVIDCAAVVGARMVVVVALVEPAKLPQVISLHPGQVLANHLVLSVPDALTDALSVDVEWDERRGALGAAARAGWGNLQQRALRAADAWQLRRKAGGRPLPPVPQVTDGEVAGQP